MTSSISRTRGPAVWYAKKALIDPGSLRWKRMVASNSSLKQRLAATFKFVSHSVLERSVFHRGCYGQVASPVDAAYLEKRYPAIRASAIPVAVPDEYLKGGQSARATATPRCGVVSIDLRQPHLRSSFFWFIQSVFRPLIAARLPLRLLVLGRVDADPALAELCSGLDVVFQRWAPDFRSALSASDILIAPDLTGTGLKNRVLQGMALGLPVVGTTVAFEGISAIDGRHACIALDAEKMKNDLAALCANSEFAQTIGASAREFVMGHFSTRAVMRRWAELYAEIAATSQ